MNILGKFILCKLITNEWVYVSSTVAQSCEPHLCPYPSFSPYGLSNKNTIDQVA